MHPPFVLVLISLPPMSACVPRPETFPGQFTAEAARVYALDDSLFRWKTFGTEDPFGTNGACDQSLEGLDPDSLDVDAEAADTAVYLEPCDSFDPDEAERCFTATRSVFTCEDAFERYATAKYFLSESCLSACGHTFDEHDVGG